MLKSYWSRGIASSHWLTEITNSHWSKGIESSHWSTEIMNSHWTTKKGVLISQQK
jgi:hypothetical protein